MDLYPHVWQEVKSWPGGPCPLYTLTKMEQEITSATGKEYHSNNYHFDNYLTLSQCLCIL